MKSLTICVVFIDLVMRATSSAIDNHNYVSLLPGLEPHVRSDLRQIRLLRRMYPSQSGITAESGRSRKQDLQNSALGRISRHTNDSSEAQQSRKRKKSASESELARQKNLLSTGESKDMRPTQNAQAELLAAKMEALQAYTTIKSPGNLRHPLSFMSPERRRVRTSVKSPNRLTMYTSIKSPDHRQATSSIKSPDYRPNLNRVPSVNSFQQTPKSATMEDAPFADQIVGIPPSLSRVKTKGDWTNGAYRKLVKENWGDYSEGAMLREDSNWHPE